MLLKYFLRYSLPAFILFLTFTNSALAQSTCGDILTTSYEEVPVDINDPDAGWTWIEVEERQPIEDCENPFGTLHPNPEAHIFFGDQEIVDGGEYAILGQTAQISFENTYEGMGNYVSVQIFRHEDPDYYSSRSKFEDDDITFTEVGTYSILLSEDVLSVSQTPLQRIKSFFIPTAYASAGDRTLFTFTVIEAEPEPEIDPLLLQYAPILYFHEDEDYYPMDVETFIDNSALWKQTASDLQLYSENDLTVAKFEEIVETEDTSDYYLAFSDPDTAKSINLDSAKTKYQPYKDATSTVYVHKMTDGYTDQSGNDHEYIVLQYWYFYAMNNWGEQGGRNNHEGDWESVFVFLDADTEEPKYVAFSSHLNDGEDGLFNLAQYASVRRSWGDEVILSNDRVVNFVSLGSHANYPGNGNEGRHDVLGENDLTSENGKHILQAIYNNIEDNGDIQNYEGLWGVDRLLLGGDGPQGPKFIDVTGQTRYSEPIEWAGIADIVHIIFADDQTQVQTTTAQFIFEGEVPEGTTLTVDPHEETINFGSNLEELNLLPNFWDIESSLENNTFNVAVTFSYDPEIVTAQGGAEEDLAAHYYNPDDDIWEVQDSVVDTETNTVTFNTTHFSRYALGIVEQQEPPEPPEPLTLDEIYEELRTVIDDSDLRFFEKRLLLLLVNQNERLNSRKHNYWQRNDILLDIFTKNVERYGKREKLSEDEVETINELVIQIKNFSEEEEPESECESRGWFSYFDRKCEWTESSGGWKSFF